MAVRRSTPQPMDASDGRPVEQTPDPAPSPAESPAQEEAVQPATGPGRAGKAPTSKFTVLLDVGADQDFGRLTRVIGEELGRIAGPQGGRLPSRADVLRAMIRRTMHDPEWQVQVRRQVYRDLTGLEPGNI